MDCGFSAGTSRGRGNLTVEQIQEKAPDIIAKTNAYMAQNMDGTPAEKIDRLVKMTDQFETFTTQSGIHFLTLLEGLLKSVLVQIWGAIEVMAGDLWEGALNEHPNHLAELHGKDNQPSTKTVPLSILNEHQFDLSKRMGTVLKDHFRFTVLDGIQSAYLRAFYSDGIEIEKAVKSQSLKALALTRNLLVHKAGVVDSVFLKEGSGIPSLSSFCACGLKHLIFVDGETTRNLVDSAILSSESLIKSVDEWLTTHPANEPNLPS